MIDCKKNGGDGSNNSISERGEAQAAIIAIFGITGDLARKKIIPALYNLYCMGLLNEKTRVVGIGRRKYGAVEYRSFIYEAASKSGCRSNDKKAALRSEEKLASFAGINDYHCADFTDQSEYLGIREYLKKIASENKICNFLYYLSTPPQNFDAIISALGSSGLSKPDFLDISCAGSFVRVVIEKPYGCDLESARTLNSKVLSIFSEEQIYRIDHYLGKETVQNIMVFRFLNGIFEPIWNQKYIDNVQIKVFESDGIGSRANYFDGAGIIRDIIQNHSLQMLSLVAMEPTISAEAESVRNEKLKVLKAIRRFDKKNLANSLAVGQYGCGKIGATPVKGYLEEDGIDKNSATETFAAIKLYIDNWRWAQVPFYLIAGKRMPERLTEVIVTFKPAPHSIFNNLCNLPGPSYNRLVIKVQPDEGISLDVICKEPGFEMNLRPVTMGFNYRTSFDKAMPEAYERLIIDALNGEATLFMRSDEIEAAWAFITPILECVKSGEPELRVYASGSPGPDLCEFFGLNLCS